MLLNTLVPLVVDVQSRPSERSGFKTYLASLISRIPPWEALFYMALLTIAGIMRFWDLGTRAIHHDESLHAFFSMNLIGGFKHNPLMHGPFQFLGISAFTNVFGSSDAAVRALAASLGTILVALPIFLRSYLGRWGSMIASLFLAFSPTLLYFSRFARNDIYMAVWTLGLIICMWGYLSSGKARYLYIGAAALSLSVATKENTYITVIILVSYLFILWLRNPFSTPEAGSKDRTALSLAPPKLRAYLSRAVYLLSIGRRYLIPSALLFTLMAGWVISATLWSLDIYDIFGRVSLTFSLVSLGVALGIYFAVIPWAPALRGPASSVGAKLTRLIRRTPKTGWLRRFLQGGSVTRLSRPGALWLLIILLMLPLTSAVVGFVQGPLNLTLVNPNSLDGLGSDHKPGFPDGAPVGEISLAIAIGLVIYLLVFTVAVGLKWSWQRFLVSGLIFWGIFVFFYTTVFTNTGQGLGSGLWQSLGYWIAQQDVRRGAQPWYYYGLLSATYEFLPLVVVLGGAAWYLYSRRSGKRFHFWMVHGFLASLFALLLLSTFWMPTSTGYQLVLGLMFLSIALSILAWYVFYADRSLLRSRVFIADLALLLLYMLNWVLPRILELRGMPVFSHIWDARSPLVVIILAGSVALIAFKTVAREEVFRRWLTTQRNRGVQRGLSPLVGVWGACPELVEGYPPDTNSSPSLARACPEPAEGEGDRGRVETVVKRSPNFTLFLVYWLALTVVLYGFAGEKMPWLMVHTTLPLAILGAKILGSLVQRIDWRRPRFNPRWLLGTGGALLVGILAFQTVWVSVEATYGLNREGNGDVPIEMLVYTQTSPDVTATLARIDELAATTGKGELLPIVVDRTSGFEYPWRWYLRDYKAVQWPCYDNNPDDTSCIPMSEPPDVDVIIMHHRNRSASNEFLTDFDEGQQIRHRAWFPEFETYKEGFGPMSVDRFFKSLVSAGSWKQWWNYFAYRELADDKRLGSEDSIVFFRLPDTSPAESYHR